MKKRNLLPILASPVSRDTRTDQQKGTLGQGLVAQTYCDLATRQCYPFAGDEAE